MASRSVQINLQAISTLTNVALLIGGAYVAYKVLGGVGGAAAGFGQSIGSTWAQIRHAFIGDVNATQGGFVLLSKYVDSEFYVMPVFVDGVKNMHPDNPKILARLLTNGQIRPEFRHFVDSQVTLSMVGG